jgi:hypothetical protein
MILQNGQGQGKIWYGMHFYPGVAEYREQGKEPFRIFINENTIRKMDPTFAGRPIFVEHVDQVEQDVNKLRSEADGWVVESFYNAADGKHWCKFITVTDEADKAIIEKKMRLSNAYIPKSFSAGGIWNGVEYDKEIIEGEFEHLALVNNPRYEESVIMTPDEFKKYNLDKENELKKLSNSKGVKRMGKFSFFKREKVENSADLESMSITLPKSGKEKTITQIINDADEAEMKKNDEMANGVEADPSHKVKLHDGSMCNVGELVEKHKALNEEHKKLQDAHEELKKAHDALEKEHGLSEVEEKVDVEGDKHNVEDEEAKKKALELAEHEEKEIVEAKKKNNFDKLKNAPKLVNEECAKVELSEDQVARGRVRYGSGK